MRRLTLLLLALSLAVVAPVAHAQAPGDRDGDGLPDASDQCPDARGNGGLHQGCPPPSDRDGDGLPDTGDRCPDAAGAGGILQGCPQSADRDGDLVLDMDDACPGTRGKQADGCEPFVWRYFFSAQSIKRFAADKPSDTTYCSAALVQCKSTHVILTLSAATAKAAGIKNRRISSFSVSIPTMGFNHDISSANRKKLARLKKITLTIRAYVTLATGEKLPAQQRTRTIYRKLGVLQQLNSNGPTDEV